jgi:Flp pilus assembly protein TadG
MLPPFIQRRGRKVAGRSREQGVTLALVAIGMFSVIAMAALSIDVGTLYQASSEAQRAADASALAAARVLSASGLTGDPTNSSGSWPTICAVATQTAQAVANQNLVGGAAPSNVNVSFISGDQQSDCTGSGPGVSFGWNPTVTVQVRQASLSTYFSRIWGRSGNSVSATATAEAFNPSNSDGALPVQPRCVKPWVVANYEPWVGSNACTTATCTPFVDAASGVIKSPGVASNTTNAAIGQTFWLMSDCRYSPSNCTLRSPQPQANVPNPGLGNPKIPPTPNVEYFPGSVPATSSAVPAQAGSCSAVSGGFANAIAGCDQSTQYQCGVQNANSVDLSENPNPDTADAVECLIHQGGGNGQDSLKTNGALTPPAPFYPFQILAGSNNPVVQASAASSGDVMTNSNSIVSLPIYDSSAPAVFTAGNTTTVTIIGFLQVFIHKVDNFGNMNVTVMNVAGCGNNASGTALTGNSPVPVRLITPP